MHFGLTGKSETRTKTREYLNIVCIYLVCTLQQLSTAVCNYCTVLIEELVLQTQFSISDGTDGLSVPVEQVKGPNSSIHSFTMKSTRSTHPVCLDVRIVSDVICPWCYLGIARLDKALVRHVDLQLVSFAWLDDTVIIKFDIDKGGCVFKQVVRSCLDGLNASFIRGRCFEENDIDRLVSIIASEGT